MRVCIDLDTGQVFSAPGSGSQLTTLAFKRSASALLEVQFARNGIVVELPSDATGIFGIKDPGEYDEADFVAGALSWVKTGTGVNTVYSFSFTFITTDLDTAFKVNGDPSDDVAQLTLMGEVQWTTGGNSVKTPTLTITVDNDIVRGGETVSGFPPSLYGLFLPSVTSFEQLDDVATVGLQVGTIVQIMIDPAGTPEWWTFRLDAGPATLGEPQHIAPDDYDAGTNDKHWVGADGQQGATGATGGVGATGATGVGATGATGAAGGVGTIIAEHYADVGNTHTDGTLDTLYSDSLGAGRLATNGDTIEAYYAIAFTGTDSTREVKLSFDGNTILNATSGFLSTANVTLRCSLIRVSSTVVRAVASFIQDDNGCTNGYVEITGLTLSNNLALVLAGAVTGGSAAAGDVKAKLSKVLYLPA